MDGRNMKVGDWGVLRNLIQFPIYNGTPAKVIKIVTPGMRTHIIGEPYISEVIVNGLRVRLIDGHTGLIKYHQIRPLRDPDQTIEQEQTEEMT
jgi:hypothetical protein